MFITKRKEGGKKDSTDLSVTVPRSDAGENSASLESIFSNVPGVGVSAEVVEVKDGCLVCTQGELNSGSARLASWATLVCCHHTELRNSTEQ